MELYIDIKPN